MLNSPCLLEYFSNLNMTKLKGIFQISSSARGVNQLLFCSRLDEKLDNVRLVGLNGRDKGSPAGGVDGVNLRLALGHQVGGHGFLAVSGCQHEGSSSPAVRLVHTGAVSRQQMSHGAASALGRRHAVNVGRVQPRLRPVYEQAGRCSRRAGRRPGHWAAASSARVAAVAR